MKLALAAFWAAALAASAASLQQQAIMRELYQIDNELTRFVLLSTTPSIVHIVGTQTCDESELINAAWFQSSPSSPVTINQTFTLDTSTEMFQLAKHDSRISIYQVDFTLQRFPCWCVLHSELTVVHIIDPAGEQINALFSSVELLPRDVGRDVQGETVGAIIILCTIPIILAAFLCSTSANDLALHCNVVGELFLQSFSSGALVAIIVFHLYPEMVGTLEDAEEPQWKGGAVILGGVCTLVTAQMLSAQLNAHYYHGDDGKMEEGHLSKLPIDKPLVPSVAILRRMAGDAVHSLVHGAVVASAFLSCGISIGWLTLGAMVAHAIPMNVHDIQQMVNENVGCTLTQAAFFSALTKLTSLVGMGIVLALGRWLGNVDAALMLGYAIGAFFFLSLTTIMPTLVVGVRTRCQGLSILVGFGVALVAIGMSTMLEQTC